MKDKEGMLKKLTAGLAAFVLTLLPLAGTVSAATLSGNPIVNPSVESGAPSDWTPSYWGSAAATFTHENEGHTGSKSIKVTNTDATDAVVTDGDAKWIPAQIPTSVLEQGGQYRFTAWYKTNTLPKAVAMYCFDVACSDATNQYFGMPAPVPAANAATSWQKYSETFSVPQGAVSVSVFMFLDRSGWLQTDDYSIESYAPNGFSDAMLTLTFDDGHEDNVTNALPLLNQYGFKTTQCYATDFVEHATSEAQAQAGIMAFYNSGHEICSHTVTHPMLTTVDDATLSYELTHSKQYLEAVIGRTVPNFATPYGDYNERVNAAIKAAGYQSHRTVDEGYNSKDNFDPYRLRVQNIQNTTTVAQVRAWIEQAKADNTWLILVYHRVAADAGQFDSFPADFAAQLETIKQSAIDVKTYQDALTSAKNQIDGVPVDVTPPVISDVHAVEGGVEVGGGFQVNWKTNELSVCTIEYGTTTAYGQTATVPAAQFTPDTFVYNMYGLSADTTYFFRINATDAAGNKSVYTGDFKTSATHLPGRVGDLTKDGAVNDDDATLLFANWGSNPAVGDLDNNGVVDDDDATLLFANWSK